MRAAVFMQLNSPRLMHSGIVRQVLECRCRLALSFGRDDRLRRTPPQNPKRQRAGAVQNAGASAAIRRLVGGMCFAWCLVLAAQAAFAAGKQLSGPYTPAAGPALAAEEAQKKFVVPEGFEVRLFAAEPDVINPVAMTWDARGRWWVVELYEYPLGAPPGAKPRDRIKIIEDTDNDGRADKVTVFADGFNLGTGLLLGNGGVYVGQAPQFLFLQDTN